VKVAGKVPKKLIVDIPTRAIDNQHLGVVRRMTGTLSDPLFRKIVGIRIKKGAIGHGALAF
jgi:hypothetical protein